MNEATNSARDPAATECQVLGPGTEFEDGETDQEDGDAKGDGCDLKRRARPLAAADGRHGVANGQQRGPRTLEASPAGVVR